MRALAHARLHWRRGELDAAEFRLEQAARDQPETSSVHAELALLRVAQERPAAADVALREAFARDPESAYARYVRSYLRLALLGRAGWRSPGDRLLRETALLKAMSDVREAIALEPCEPLYRVRLSELLRFHRKPGAALEVAEKAVALDPRSIRALSALASALVALGRLDAGRRTFLDALSRDPESAELHAQLGWALVELEDDSAAARSFQEALRLDPSLDEAAAGALLCAKRESAVYRWVSVRLRRFMRRSSTFRASVLLGVFLPFFVAVRLAGSGAKGPLRILGLCLLLYLPGLLACGWEPFHNWRVRRHASARTSLAEGVRAGRRRFVFLVAGTILLAGIAGLLGAWDRRVSLGFVGLVPGAVAFALGWRIGDSRLRRRALAYGASVAAAGAVAGPFLDRHGWAPTGLAFGLSMALPILPAVVLRNRDRRSQRESLRESVRRTLK